MEYQKSRYNLPLTPPHGLKEFMRGHPDDVVGVILYKMEYYTDAFGRGRRGVKCSCSECETSFFADHAPAASATVKSVYGWFDEHGNAVYDGDVCICPVCGASVTAHYIGRNRNGFKTLECNSAITVERVDGKAAIVLWFSEYTYYDGGRFEFRIYPWEAYVFDGRRCVKNVAYSQYGYFNHREYAGEWYERKRCIDTIGNVEQGYIYPFDAHIFDGTELENAKFDIYIKENENAFVFPVSYLRLYQRHNTVENLVVQGSMRIISNLLNGGYNGLAAPLTETDHRINWKARRPSAMLGLTKPEYKALKDLSLHDIEFYNEIKGFGITPENYGSIKKKTSEYTIKTLINDFSENISRADRYITKQKKKYRNSVTLDELVDYWRMVEPPDRLKDSNIRYPQNLRHAHDELVRLKKWKEDKELMEKFLRRYEELSIYSYSNGSLLIRPCRDEAELINEGKTLKHCVASYAKRHASGTTSIFFIRHVDRPDEPYYTLEWTGCGINQDHGYKNRLQTDEIKEFEKEWLEFVKGVNENGQHSRKAS